jgi:hypothetical protein
MEGTVPLSFVTWMLGFLLSLLGGCWAIFKFFEAKLNRVYKRLDERHDEYYKVFVTGAVYDAEVRARKENTDERFQQLVLLFNEKIESLRTEIRLFVRSATNGSGKDHF